MNGNTMQYDRTRKYAKYSMTSKITGDIETIPDISINIVKSIKFSKVMEKFECLSQAGNADGKVVPIDNSRQYGG